MRKFYYKCFKNYTNCKLKLTKCFNPFLIRGDIFPSRNVVIFLFAANDSLCENIDFPSLKVHPT